MNDLKKVLERRTAVPAWSISTLDSDGSSAPAAPRDYATANPTRNRASQSVRERETCKESEVEKRTRQVTSRGGGGSGGRSEGSRQGERRDEVGRVQYSTYRQQL